MILNRLSLVNFKNFADAHLDLGPSVNAFVGDNGAGKTNVIDAVWMLSMGRSAFGMSDRQCVRHDAGFFMVDGTYTTDGGKTESVVCSYGDGHGKVLKRNGKEYERLSDHVGFAPAVIVSPADTMLVSEAAEERRRYLNAFISQFDRVYLEALVRYNQILQSRNRLLKTSPTEDLLEIYDLQLDACAATIHPRRAACIERLQPLVERYYRTISADREAVEIGYRSALDELPMIDLLRQTRPKDMVMEFTTAGLHRDDLIFKIGGYPLRRYGSQGQQKSFLVALKLAQYAVVAEQTGVKPLLLLDDLFDKLDAGRVEQLLRLVVGERFGQILITDCNPERLAAILDRAGAPYTLFHVADGQIL